MVSNLIGVQVKVIGLLTHYIGMNCIPILRCFLTLGTLPTVMYVLYLSIEPK